MGAAGMSRPHLHQHDEASNARGCEQDPGAAEDPLPTVGGIIPRRAGGTGELETAGTQDRQGPLSGN